MKKFVKMLSEQLIKLSKTLTGKEIKNVGGAMRELRKAVLGKDSLPDMKKYLRRKKFDKNVFKTSIWMMTNAGSSSFRNFIKGVPNARYSPPFFFMLFTYLGWESSCGVLLDGQEADVTNGISISADDLECRGKGLTPAIGKVVAQKALTMLGGSADNVWNDQPLVRTNINAMIGGEHGAAFHLMQLAYYQALARAGGDKVKDSEAGRKVTFPTVGDGEKYASVLTRVEAIENNKNAEKVGIPFQRYVDIVLFNEQEKLERWVELKSYKASNRRFGLWSYPNGSSGKIHKQMLVDWVATRFGYAITTGDNAEGRVQVAKTVCPGLSNGSVWRFQRFKKSGVEPTLSLDVGAFNQTGSAVWLAAQTPKSGMDVHQRDIIFEKAPQAGNKCMGQRVVSANFKDFVTELTKIGLDYMIDNKDELMNALGEFE